MAISLCCCNLDLFRILPFPLWSFVGFIQLNFRWKLGRILEWRHRDLWPVLSTGTWDSWVRMLQWDLDSGRSSLFHYPSLSFTTPLFILPKRLFVQLIEKALREIEAFGNRTYVLRLNCWLGILHFLCLLPRYTCNFLRRLDFKFQIRTYAPHVELLVICRALLEVSIIICRFGIVPFR